MAVLSCNCAQLLNVLSCQKLSMAAVKAIEQLPRSSDRPAAHVILWSTCKMTIIIATLSKAVLSSVLLTMMLVWLPLNVGLKHTKLAHAGPRCDGLLLNMNMDLAHAFCSCKTTGGS